MPQVEDVVGENDRLRAGAQEHLDGQMDVGLKECGDAPGQEHRLRLMSEENELLRRENDLLISQQVGNYRHGVELATPLELYNTVTYHLAFLSPHIFPTILQDGLEEELHRLHKSLQEQSAEALMAVQENAAASAREREAQEHAQKARADAQAGWE